MRSARRSSGMTGIEVVVYIALFTAVLYAIVTSIQYFYRTNSYAIEQASAVASAQRGIDRMVREIREAAYASDGAYPVVSIADNAFTFYADVDTEPLIEKVHYYISGTRILRGVVDPSGDPPVYTAAEVSGSLSDSVRNLDHGVPIFQYYDKNGALITDFSKVADVRFVSVKVQVDVNPDRSPTPLLIQSNAAMRNIK